MPLPVKKTVISKALNAKERTRKHVLWLPGRGWSWVPAWVRLNLHRGAGGRGLSPSEELKPAAWVAIPEEKGVGVTKAPRLPLVDQGPQGVAEEGREGPRALGITFQRLHDLEFLRQVGAAAEGHARKAGELREAGVRAQGRDALGGRERAAEQLALLRQLPELPLLLLLEEPSLREVILPAEGQPPQRRLQVVGARGARRPRLLTLLLVSGRRGDGGERGAPSRGRRTTYGEA